jgi:hypothetical protein
VYFVSITVISSIRVIRARFVVYIVRTHIYNTIVSLGIYFIRYFYYFPSSPIMELAGLTRFTTLYIIVLSFTFCSMTSNNLLLCSTFVDLCSFKNTILSPLSSQLHTTAVLFFFYDAQKSNVKIFSCSFSEVYFEFSTKY